MGKFLLAVLGLWGLNFLLSPAFAAPTISITSSPEMVTINQQFALTASVSGLASASSYFVKIRLGSTSATMSKGQTYNALNDSPDDWLADTSDWTKFPTITSDSLGVWTGDLTARPAGTAFSGPNYLTLRLRSTAGTNYPDSASVSATVLSAVQTTVATIPPAPSPFISLDFPGNVRLGDSFKIKLTISSFDPNPDYYYKIRAGLTETLLNKVQTQNGAAFLSDAESWTKFPLVHIDSSGNWSGEVIGRFDEDKETGVYKIRVRLRKKDTETSIDSPLHNITVVAPVVLAASPTAVVVSATPPQMNLVLATQSSRPVATESSPAPPPQKVSYAPLVMVGLGAAIVVVSAVIFVLSRGSGIMQEHL